MRDLPKFIEGLHRYIGEALAPLAERIKSLEGREPVPGPAGEKGEPGANGADGAPGRDGATADDLMALLAPHVEAKMAAWALDFERRATGTLERAVDRLPKPADGKDGRDGADGFGFDDLTVEHDGEGAVTIKFTKGERVKEFALRVPAFIDRGVYREGEKYLAGNGVSFGGSFWLAQKDAPEGKPGLSDGWRLAAKKGRDGKDGEKAAAPRPVIRVGG